MALKVHIRVKKAAHLFVVLICKLHLASRTIGMAIIADFWDPEDSL